MRLPVLVATVICCLMVYTTASPQQPNRQPNNASPADQKVKDVGGAAAATESHDHGTTQPPQTTEQQRGHPLSSVESFLAWLDSVDPNRIMALLTAIIAVFTLVQMRAAVISNRHNTVVERAYLSISCDEIHGVAVGTAKPWAVLKLKNVGQTPADVLSIGMGLFVAPDLPDRARQAEIQSNSGYYLAPQDEFLGTFSVQANLDTDQFHQIQVGGLKLWLIGHVDYVDRFGKRHRLGFTRRYLPTPIHEGQTANLIFEEKGGYNYDRKLKG